MFDVGNFGTSVGNLNTYQILMLEMLGSILGNVCVLNSYIENPGTSIGKCMCTNFRNWDCWNWYWEHNYNVGNARTKTVKFVCTKFQCWECNIG